MEPEGRIFDIKRYAIHDGPGIRTTIFLKGCPLNCPWCHNPEGIASEQQLMWWSGRCISCHACQDACPEGCISFSDHQIIIDEDRCTMCGDCVSACYPHALELVARKVTVDDVIREVERDIVFYDQSGGGVTFSGGEPLMQPEFLLKLLKACKDRGIHTVVDTCGYGDSDNVVQISEHVDLFLWDLKMIDDEKHREFTGVANQLILENLARLSARGKEVVVRFSLIPGINDSEQDICKLGTFVQSLSNVERLDILPYHRVGVEKSRRVNRRSEPYDNQTPSPNVLKSIEEQLTGFDLKVRIGG